jgi:hypothetical protein
MKKLYIAFLVMVLALAMIVPVGAVNADSPQIEVSGGVELDFDFDAFVIEKTVGNGNVMICSLAFFVIYTGDLEGEAYETLDGMVNFNPKSGAFHSEGMLTFEGTLLGKEGTFTAHVTHQGQGTECRVVQTIISSTGELANLHGTIHLTVAQDVPGAPYTGTYSGKLHFAP